MKGTFPTREEKDKARSLAERSGYPVYFFYGEIPHPDPNDQSWNTASALAFFADGTMDEAYWWCECPICHSAAADTRSCCVTVLNLIAIKWWRAFGLCPGNA